MITLYVVSFSLIGSILSISVAGSFMLLKEERRDKLVSALISFATGTLLASAFIGVLPHALEHGDREKVFIALVFSLIFFFAIEKLMIWRHCHKDGCDVHYSSGVFILIGDSIHNFVDGLILASIFIQDIKLGIATGIAIVLHEIPQEVGDFAVLLHSGFKPFKAYIYNLISGLFMLLGAIIPLLMPADLVHDKLPMILAFSAASFIYISVADLMPGLQKTMKPKESLLQIILILLGIVFIIGFQVH